MKSVFCLAVVAASLGLGWYLGSRPPDIPPRPTPPTKTDTVYIESTPTVEIVQKLTFVPGPDVPVPVPYRVEIFKTDTVPCQSVQPRTRIMRAEFGESYGDTSSVVIERMSFDEGSLLFQTQIERLYTGGMPKRIWTDSGQTMVEWIDYPVIRVSSCSIGTKLLSGAVGYGVGKVGELILGKN